MTTLRRSLNTQVRVLDEKNGLVEYIASSESLDTYNEIVMADGWRLNRIQKNFPFVDSHNYESIDCLLGRGVNCTVEAKQLITTVKWAIDVPQNLLAQKGFAMTKAGYLKAVSVGFIPIRTVTRFDGDQTTWKEACEKAGQDPAQTDCRAIYLEQELLELSACVLGSNADAVARSVAAGIFTADDVGRLSGRYPQLARTLQAALESHSHRTYSFSSGETRNQSPPQTKPKSMSREAFLQEVTRATGPARTALENIETSRRGGSEAELEGAVRLAFTTLAREYQFAYGNPIERYLNADPERRYLWNGAVRKLAGTIRIKSQEYAAVEKAIKQRAASGINLQDSFGSGLLFAIPIGEDLYDLLLHYGAYKDLGLRKMVGQYTKFAKTTAYPAAIFITPTQQGLATIPTDTSLAGTNITPEANTIAALIEASRAWLDDEKIDLSEIIVAKFVQALASRIDWACFQGNGNDDQQNGLAKGIFFDPAVQSTVTNQGVVSIGNLQRSDFINVVGGVAPATLQHMTVQSPRWYINPALIPQLLLLTEANGTRYLLKTPAETQGEWVLVGFPVTWAAQAPSAVAPNAPIAAFGNPDAYLVALHEQFEITLSEKGPGFGYATTQFRAIGRGQSIMRESTGFARLQFAAQ